VALFLYCQRSRTLPDFLFSQFSLWILLVLFIHHNSLSTWSTVAFTEEANRFCLISLSLNKKHVCFTKFYCRGLMQTLQICITFHFHINLHQQMPTLQKKVFRFWDDPRQEGKTPVHKKVSVSKLLQVHFLQLAKPPAQPEWTGNHQRTIHWMVIMTQLWMNLNWVNIWFHLGNPSCKK